jgi:hypothetical protein
MAEVQITVRQAAYIMQRAKLGFEQAKHLATLNTASILLISGFLQIIFPDPLKETCG